MSKQGKNASMAGEIARGGRIGLVACGKLLRADAPNEDAFYFSRRAFLPVGDAVTGCNLTPGLSSLRKMIPAFSRVSWTSARVEVRDPTGPVKDSMRRIVPMATLDRAANSTCSHPIKARAAFSCLPVITA
jgi:hypothetical protein